ncbi:MAG TPA: L-threonylcarbamoyladenylate synthase [Puia sp.]|nr:L-threonylcarbamoyladenylate synthase [Puia sp.]
MVKPDFQNDLKKCIETLIQGGLILYPTDTVWGIGCDATNSSAVKKIFDLKKRADSKSLIVLVAEERDILKCVTQLDLHVFDYLRTVQKPTTVIYEGAIGLADNVMNANGTVAIRVVKEIFCKQLIKQFLRPIVSTSANVSNSTTPQNFAEISAQIKQGVDYIVQYRQEEKTKHQPSSVIQFNKDGTIKMLRD